MLTFLPIALFVGLLGPFVGSFIAVLSDRLPRAEDVVRAPSRCRGCDRALKWFQVVPILSFVVQRGRCRTCNATIPAYFLYLEIVALGLGVLAILAGGTGSHVLLTALMLWLLLALLTCDLAMFRLPDFLTAALAGVVLLRAPDLLWALQGAVAGAAVFLLIRWVYAKLRGREGLGLGDVKLMAGLGGLAGPLGLPELVLLGAVFTIGMGLWKARSLTVATPLPFGAALCAAAMCLWAMGRF